MLMRRAALDEVGLFDEGYWMYMEDLDLCYRFAQAGWVTWYEPTVTVVHVKAGTSGSAAAPRLNYAFHYGMFRFYREHYAPPRSAAVNTAVYAGIAAKFAVSAAERASTAASSADRQAPGSGPGAAAGAELARRMPLAPSGGPGNGRMAVPLVCVHGLAGSSR